MKRVLKQTLSLMLTAIIVVAALPFSVVAEDKTTFKKGDIVEFGSYPQTEVKESALIDVLNA